VSDRTNHGSLYPVATSGTTDRVMLFHDEYKRDWDRAADMLLRIHMHSLVFGGRQVVIPADACYERCGADEHGRLSTVRGKLLDFVRAGSGQHRKAARQVISQIMRDYVWRETMLKAFGVDGTATSPAVLDEYIESIKTVRPDLLHALPQYAHGLAKHVDTRGIDVQIKMIRPSGGKFTEEMIRMVEAAFSARVRENYGTAELGTVAFDCRMNRRQHLLSELFFIEFVRGGKHVAPGELGELLITDLRNRVAPLIRYAIGDVGRYFDQPCRCGYRGLTFTVDSRLDETIVTPTGDAFSGSQVVDFFLSRPEIDYVKVIQQREDSFIIEAVPASGYDRLPDSSELGEDFSRFLGHQVKLRLRKVRRLAPERNGKYKLVDSCSYERFNGVTTNG
ncbi:MAG: phenylacetate--CoA ligase family protein, partial [Planctomycetota bacterium]